MDASWLSKKFTRIGARLKVVDRPVRRLRTSGLLSLDIGTDRRGEFFEHTAGQVVMNTENESRAMRNVAFLD